MEEHLWHAAPFRGLQMTGKCRLAWQQGSNAIFAEISVVAERILTEQWSIVLPTDIDPSIAAGIRFGFELFREACLTDSNSRGAVHVQVEGIHVVPCDTTVTSVAFVTFHALANALESNAGNIFVFDRTSGAFSIACPSDSSRGESNKA